MSSAETATVNCRNCHQMVTGEFCSHCGQRRSDTLDGRQAVRALAGATLDIEGPWRRTLIDLLLRPNILIRDYLAGARKRYVNPVLMLLLLITAFYMLSSVLGIDIFADVRKLKHGNVVSDLMQDYSAYLYMLVLWPAAAMTGRLWPGTRTAERFMGLLYATCTYQLLMFLTLPLYGRLNNDTILLMSTVAGPLAAVYALRNIRPTFAGSALSVIVIYLLSSLLQVLVGAVLGIVLIQTGVKP